MFDGVHRGHVAVLQRLRAVADEHQATAVVVTFDVHPRTVVHTFQPVPMITSLEHRLQLFEQHGVDSALTLPFDQELADIPAATFVQQILIEYLQIEALVLGHDAHFGKQREGNLDWIAAQNPALPFAVHAVEPVRLGEQIVSSTAIRNAVASGDLATASAMLDRPVGVLGTVCHGRGIGTKLGFPTLNIDPHHELQPPPGVYATSTRFGDTVFPSVTNIGFRPSIEGAEQSEMPLIECHLLDFNGDLYGQSVEVRFFMRFRAEQRFANGEALVAQINHDVEQARAFHDQMAKE